MISSYFSLPSFLPFLLIFLFPFFASLASFAVAFGFASEDEDVQG